MLRRPSWNGQKHAGRKNEFEIAAKGIKGGENFNNEIVEMSKLRVAERVAHGGHNIPVTDIERRFPRGLSHLLNDFSHCVDSCTCFMNDGESPVLVFEQRGSDREIVHDDYYQLLLEEAKR